MYSRNSPPSSISIASVKSTETPKLKLSCRKGMIWSCFTYEK